MTQKGLRLCKELQPNNFVKISFKNYQNYFLNIFLYNIWTSLLYIIKNWYFHFWNCIFYDQLWRKYCRITHFSNFLVPYCNYSSVQLCKVLQWNNFVQFASKDSKIIDNILLINTLLLHYSIFINIVLIQYHTRINTLLVPYEFIINNVIML